MVSVILIILATIFILLAAAILIHNLTRGRSAYLPACPHHLYNPNQDREAKEYEVATQVIYFVERVCGELSIDMEGCKVLGELYRHRKITYWTTGQEHFLSKSSPEMVEAIINDPRPFSRALKAMVDEVDIPAGAVQRLPRDLKMKILEYRPWNSWN